ncbi:MAG: VPLPA-CTERM sorting domain-containing protein [Pseudomonadota bacterium]
MRSIFVTAFAAFALAGAAHASTMKTITFEGLSNGQVVNSIDGVSVSATGGIGEAVIFDTSLDGTADPDLEAPLFPVSIQPTLGNIGSGNVLIIQENATGGPDDNARGGTFTFDFNGLVEITDFVGVDFRDNAPGPQNLSFEIFRDTMSVSSFDFAMANPTVAVGNNRFFSFLDVLTGMDSVGDQLVITVTGSAGIDNISFNVIPIPAAAPLFLTALAGAGFMRRRRKAATA